MRPANGSSNSANAMGANPPRDNPARGCVNAASLGNVTVMVTFVALEFCGNDGGVKFAVAPVGNPVTEKVTVAGKLAPLGGPTASI